MGCIDGALSVPAYAFCGILEGIRLLSLRWLGVQRVIHKKEPFGMGGGVAAEGENVVVPHRRLDPGQIHLDPVVVVSSRKDRQSVFPRVDLRHVVLVRCPVRVPDLDAVHGARIEPYAIDVARFPERMCLYDREA